MGETKETNNRIRKKTTDGEQNKQDPQQHNKGKRSKKSNKPNTGNRRHNWKVKQAGPTKHNELSFHMFNLIRKNPDSEITKKQSTAKHNTIQNIYP